MILRIEVKNFLFDWLTIGHNVRKINKNSFLYSPKVEEYYTGYLIILI
jgi:hypothetical protein